MKRAPNTTYYPPLEEKINVWSHGFGFVLSVLAFIILINRASALGTATHIVSFSIFGASLVLLYAASTFFHNAKGAKLRHRLNVLDHASIYILIAGTYTPYASVTLHGTVGWTVLAVVWGIAIAGIILKLFFTGRYQLLSTIMYVVMGWIVVFAIKPLVANLSFE